MADRRPSNRNGPRRLVRLRQPMERPPGGDDGTGPTEHEWGRVIGPAELPPGGDRSDDGDECGHDTDVLEVFRPRGASGHAETVLVARQVSFRNCRRSDRSPIHSGDHSRQIYLAQAGPGYSPVREGCSGATVRPIRVRRYFGRTTGG